MWARAATRLWLATLDDDLPFDHKIHYYNVLCEEELKQDHQATRMQCQPTCWRTCLACHQSCCLRC